MGCVMSNVELEWPSGWVCNKSQDQRRKHGHHHRNTQQRPPPHHPHKNVDSMAHHGGDQYGGRGGHGYDQNDNRGGGGGGGHREYGGEGLQGSGHLSNRGGHNAPPPNPHEQAYNSRGGGHHSSRSPRAAPASPAPAYQQQSRARPEGSHSYSRSGPSPVHNSEEGETDEGPMEFKKKLKLILLGSGESGKSTFFKRMLIQYGRGYNDDECIDFRDSIYENTIEAMQTLVRECQESGDPDWEIAEDLQETAEKFLEIKEGEMLTRGIAEKLMRLWGDKGVRKAYENRATFSVPVPDGAQYFFDDVYRLARRDYIPTSDDVLRCRDRTIGVQSETLALETPEYKAEFELFDVGGQQSERRHWQKVFKDVDAVLFVVALSDYDMKCFEDTTVDRMQDSSDVFKMVGNSRRLDCPIVLIFNKVDLFTEKLEKGVKFDFHDYDGEQTYEQITLFLQEEFEDLCERNKEIVTHMTCAIERGFNADDLLSDVLDAYAEKNR